MNRTILCFQLRRERILLPVWIMGIVGLFTASGLAIAREFGDEAQRSAVIALAAGNPAFLFLRGLPDGTDVGAVTFFQTFSFLAVLTGLMTVFLITRHTRAEEDSGRSELLHATPVPRSSTLRGVLTIAVTASVVLAALVVFSGLLLGLDLSGALLTGAALGSTGIAFTGIAALAAQIMPTARGSNALGAAAVGAAYLIRGIGDALGTATDTTHVAASWISLLSPIGWAQSTRPFGEPQPLPLLVPVLLGAVTVSVALVIQHRRDLGHSLLVQRRGSARWAHAGAWALAYRAQWPSTIGWTVGTVILGFLAGAISPFVLDAVGANDDLAALIRRLAPQLEVDTGQLFAIALLGICATLAAAAGVQTILRLRADEVEDRAELILTTRLSRTGWMTRQLVVAATSTVVVAVAGALAAGAGFLLAGDGPGRVGSSLATVAVHLPAGMIFVAVTALSYSLIPRLTIPLGWGLLTAGLVLGQLGDLIGLPRWIQDLSPFRHVPAVPIETADPVPLLLMIAAALVAAALAVFTIRLRDVPH